MSAPTGTLFAWELPTASPSVSDLLVLTPTGTMQAYQESVQGLVNFLGSQGLLITGSYTLLNGKYQPSGSISTSGFITGSYPLLDGRYLPSGTMYFNINFHVGNGSAVVPTGSFGAGYPPVEVPPCVIDSWQVYADVTGSFTANILKSTSSGYPPTSPLAGLGQPILTNQRKNSGNATGTITLAQNDVLQIQVASAATVELVTVSLRARRV